MRSPAAFDPRNLLALTLALSSTSVATASDAMPTFVERGRTVQGYAAAGKAGFALGDFDGDGRTDMIVPGYLGPPNAPSGSVLQVLTAGESGIGVKQTILLRSTAIVRIVAWTPAGDTAHLLSIDSNGVATDWSGLPLQSIRTFNVDSGVTAAAIGDIDNDGALELLTLQMPGTGRLAVHDLTTGQLKWTRSDVPGVDLALVQLDGDPALEIVVAAWDLPGVVLDGATRAAEWTYAEGFGTYVATGRVVGDGTTGFATAQAWGKFGVFRGNPWSLIWSLPAPRDTDAIAVADIDGDGLDEIIRADGQWGSLHVHDSITGALRLSIPNPANGVSAVAAVDLTGGGQPAIAFAPGSPAFATDPLLQFSSPLDGSTLHTLPYLPPPYAPVLVGKLDNDNRAMLLHAVQGPYPFLRMLDMQTGQELWRSTGADLPDSPFRQFAPRSLYLSRALGGTQQFLIVGNVHYSGQIIALDPVSHTVRWRTGGEEDPVTRLYSIHNTTLFDFDGDGIDDIVTCASGFTRGPRILVFSGADGSSLWQSITFDYLDCRGLLAGEFGGATEVVALLGGALYAFNRDTHLLDWTMAVPGEAVHLLDGVDGPEIAIVLGESLSFYRAADRELLRVLAFDAKVAHVQQLDNDIHRLLIATDGVLKLVDGVTGQVSATSTYVGEWMDWTPDSFNAFSAGSGAYSVGVGNAAGVFRFDFFATDEIFSGGFERLD